MNHELLGRRNPMAPPSLDASLTLFLLAGLLQDANENAVHALAGSQSCASHSGYWLALTTWVGRTKKTIVAICVTETHSGHTKSTPRWRNQRAASPYPSCDFLFTHSPTLFHCFHCWPVHFQHCSSLFASHFMHSFLPNLVPICNLDSLFHFETSIFSPNSLPCPIFLFPSHSTTLHLRQISPNRKARLEYATDPIYIYIVRRWNNFINNSF